MWSLMIVSNSNELFRWYLNYVFHHFWDKLYIAYRGLILRNSLRNLWICFVSYWNFRESFPWKFFTYIFQHYNPVIDCWLSNSKPIERHFSLNFVFPQSLKFGEQTKDLFLYFVFTIRLIYLYWKSFFIDNYSHLSSVDTDRHLQYILYLFFVSA